MTPGTQAPVPCKTPARLQLRCRSDKFPSPSSTSFIWMRLGCHIQNWTPYLLPPRPQPNIHSLPPACSLLIDSPFSTSYPSLGI